MFPESVGLSLTAIHLLFWNYYSTILFVRDIEASGVIFSDCQNNFFKKYLWQIFGTVLQQKANIRSAPLLNRPL
jgi:hypothetical protein